jgi:hypothetical protein
MDAQSLARSAPYLLFAVAALSLFAIGEALARRRRPAPELIAADGKTKMMSLLEAAEAIYETARRERMVIATVAERAGGEAGALAWFAQSIAGVIPIYRARDAQAFEKLPGQNVGTELQSLYIQKRDYQTYVRWARSMQ